MATTRSQKKRAGQKARVDVVGKHAAPDTIKTSQGALKAGQKGQTRHKGKMVDVSFHQGKATPEERARIEARGGTSVGSQGAGGVGSSKAQQMEELARGGITPDLLHQKAGIQPQSINPYQQQIPQPIKTTPQSEDLANMPQTIGAAVEQPPQENVDLMSGQGISPNLDVAGARQTMLGKDTPEVLAMKEKMDETPPWAMALGLVSFGGSGKSLGRFTEMDYATRSLKSLNLEIKMAKIGKGLLRASKMTAFDVADDAMAGIVEYAPGRFTKSTITKAAMNTVKAKNTVNWLKAVASTAKNPKVAFGLLMGGLAGGAAVTGTLQYYQGMTRNLQDDLESSLKIAMQIVKDDPTAYNQIREIYDNYEWDALTKMEKYAPLYNYNAVALRKHRANKESIAVMDDFLERNAIKEIARQEAAGEGFATPEDVVFKG